jgi:hypothetical protein
VAPDNHDLRVKLLLGKITEMQMKVEIQMRAKHYQKELAVQQINDMVTNASNDLLRNYYQELKAVTNVWEIVKDADGVKPYWINMEGQKSDTIKTPRIYDVHQPIHAKFNTEMLSLIEYVNKCYTRIEKAFNNKIERINLYY